MDNSTLINVEDGKLITTHIDNLVPSEYNKFNVTDIADLEGSILSMGLIHPLSVIGPTTDGKYIILSGERRYRAIRHIIETGRQFSPNIPCYIIGPANMDVNEQKLIIESANLETRDDVNKDQHRFAIIQILREMADDKVKYKNRAAIIRAAGRYMSGSERYRSMYLRIFDKGANGLQQAVEEHKIPVQEAARVAGMAPEVQQNIINDLNNGVKSKDAIQTHAPKPAPKKKSDIPMDAAELEFHRRAKEGGDFDDDDILDDDLFDTLIDQGSGGVNLDCDTTGELAKLNRNTMSRAERDEDMAHNVITWCERMKRKSEFSETEIEAFDAIRSLVEHLDESDIIE
jgi:hypothetical protein